MGKIWVSIGEKIEPWLFIITIAVVVAVLKILMTIRTSTEKDNTKLALEFIISVGAGIVGGVLTDKLADKESWTILVACICTFLGSKILSYFNEISDTAKDGAVKTIKKKMGDKDDGNNIGSTRMG